MIDIDAICRDFPLPHVVGSLVKLQAAGTEFKALCPFHSEGTPSFTIYAGGRRFFCFGCGAGGDVLDFVQRYYGLDFAEAVEHLTGSGMRVANKAAATAPQSVDRTAEALAIWDAATAVAGSPAETYLHARGISLDWPATLRFDWLAAGRGPTRPALIALSVNKDGAPIGIQRTFLKQDGSAKSSMSKPKLSLGRISGGAIRLGDLTATGEVFVTEGLEDGLSLMQIGAETVWVAAGASHLPKMEFPHGVTSIVIGADNDIAGSLAAAEATEAFSRRGYSVRIICPKPGMKDFNDELREAADD